VIASRLSNLLSLKVQIIPIRLELESFQSLEFDIRQLHRLTKTLGSRGHDYLASKDDIRVDCEVELGRIWEQVGKMAEAKSIARKLFTMVDSDQSVDLIMLSKRLGLLERTLHDLEQMGERDASTFHDYYSGICSPTTNISLIRRRAKGNREVMFKDREPLLPNEKNIYANKGSVGMQASALYDAN
jgi:hypothetical protein